MNTSGADWFWFFEFAIVFLMFISLVIIALIGITLAVFLSKWLVSLL